MSEMRNSNLFGKITVIIVICFIVLPAQAKYGGGTGEPNDPYLIYTAAQMNAIGANAVDWDKHFKLMADIDLSSYTGTAFNIIGNFLKRFSGVFDGNGHIISNFSYTSTGTSGIGLFGWVDDPNAEVKDLGFIDPNVDAGTGSKFVGSLVGCLRGGNITGCYVEGGRVAGDEVGGLAGRNCGTINNCYTSTDVSGNRRAGGLVGWNLEGTITYCYSTGSVSGDRFVGGLVGVNDKGTVSNSFWDIETSGQTTSTGGTGLLTDEMQTMSTFTDADWDFENIWWILEGACYPRLCWEDKYGGGSGRPNDPYLIYTAEQMNAIGACQLDWGKHFKLMADIGLSGYTGTSFNIIGNKDNPFRGVFDGNGHEISNFSYTSIDKSYIGLFGYVTGQINNFGLIDPYVDGGTGGGVGSLVGWLINGTITACYAEEASVSGRYWVGGLVGRNGGTITNCYSTASVSGTGWDAGGLVGQNDAKISSCCSTASVSGNKYVGGLLGENCGTIIDCYSEGVVSGTTNVGGLAGRNYYGIISNSNSNGDVSGTTKVGGLVGGNYGSISHCYSTGFVSGDDWYVGGLVGDNYEGSISQCYSTGDVRGDERVGCLVGVNNGSVSHCYSTGDVTGYGCVGGLVGYNDEGSISNCCSTGDVSGTENVGGLVGGNGGGISNCYSTGDISGDWNVGGLAGGNFNSISNCFWDTDSQTHSVTESIGDNQGTATNVAGLPTAQMQKKSTFVNAGWDFNTPVWTIEEGVDYPRLWWEFVPILQAEPEITIGTNNTISWEPVAGKVEYYAECAEDANFNNIVYNSGWITETSFEFTRLELGRQYWYSVKARNAEGVESQWSNVESSLQCTLTDVVELIETLLSPESLKNENMKNALLNKIDAAMKMIGQANYTGALSKLEQDILQKTNGCAETGQPDKNDWTITCEAQNKIYALIIETIEYVKALTAE